VNKISSSVLLAISAIIVMGYVLKKLNIHFVVQMSFYQFIILILVSIIVVYFILSSFFKKSN
jgi:hypothetical protein